MASHIQEFYYVSFKRKLKREVLLTVLLGLRICFKEDLHASSAEMLYGSTLRIPGESFIEEDFSQDPEIVLEKQNFYEKH